MTKISKEAKNFFDRVSALSGDSIKEPKGTALRTIEAAQRYLTSEAVVLDYGCGAGDLTLTLAPKVKTIHAIDTSRGMIEAAKCKAKRSGIGNVEFVRAGLNDVEHLAGTINIITAFNVLHYVDDPQEVSQKISALLAPRGIFISSTACLGEKWTLLGTITQFLTKLSVIPTMHRFEKPELNGLIVSGGFKIVEANEVSGLPEYFIVAEKN